MKPFSPNSRTLFITGFIIVCFTLGMISCFPGTALSQPGPNPDPAARLLTPHDQMAFAHHQFDNQRFDQAANEYQRFIFFFPKDPMVPEALYKMARCYFNMQEYQMALDGFSALIQQHPDSAFSISARFAMADCHVAFKDYFRARTLLAQAAASTDKKTLEDRAFYETGWIFMEDRQWDDSRASFQKISPENQIRYGVAPLLSALDQTRELPHKNPSLSGILSVMPGGGYLYCHRPKDALMAFLLNGGLIFAAQEAFHNDSPALGGVITFVELGFYAGNIYGGIASAHKYNQRQEAGWMERLKENHRIRISANPANARIGLIFESRF
jgi:tetratricopeptide (TPR) repeat protein